MPDVTMGELEAIDIELGDHLQQINGTARRLHECLVRHGAMRAKELGPAADASEKAATFLLRRAAEHRGEGQYDRLDPIGEALALAAYAIRKGEHL